jgi:hypothetical protein
MRATLPVSFRKVQQTIYKFELFRLFFKIFRSFSKYFLTSKGTRYPTGRHAAGTFVPLGSPPQMST